MRGDIVDEAWGAASSEYLDMSELSNLANAERTKIWRTRGARFNAARRMHLKNILSTFSISVLACWGIALPIIQKVYGIPPGSAIDDHYTFVSIVASLFVLIISLLEGAQAYGVKQEHFDLCAKRLGEISSEFELLIATAGVDHGKLASAIAKATEQYHRVLSECAENHEPIDDTLFLAQHRYAPEFLESKIGRGSALLMHFTWWIASTWLFVVLLAVPVFWFAEVGLPIR
jgi:hypothetical protein